MLEIKIYGTGTPGYQLAKSKLAEMLNISGLEYKLEEVTNISEIMSDNITSVPAVKVNNSQLYEIKPNGSYQKSLRDTIQNILKSENYGKMLKIIVPTDFSEPSLNAYNFANHLAKEFQGVVRLSHVYYPTSADVNQMIVVNDEVENIHRAKLDNLVQSLNQDWIGNFVAEPMVEGVFKVGFPKMELIEMSKDPDTVLVMGTTGTGDAFKKIFGSLSLDIIDECYCPLYLIPPGCHYPATNEIVYLSEDLKNDSLHLLYVGRICMKIGANFKLVHYRKGEEIYDVTDTINLIESYFPSLDYKIEIEDTNDIFGNIKNMVGKKENHLVVLSTKHRNIFQNLFHKSVTEFAALNSICPLLILSDKSME